MRRRWQPGNVSSGEGFERIARDAMRPPFFLGLCAERGIEVERGSIPIEHRPLETTEIFCDAAPRQMDEQGAANTVTAILGLDEEIFEIKTVPTAEGREVVEPERKACALTVPFGDLAKNAGVLGEQRRLQIDEGRIDLVQ